MGPLASRITGLRLPFPHFPSLRSSPSTYLHTNPSPPAPTLIYSARLPFASRVLGLSSLQSGASLSALPLCFQPVVISLVSSIFFLQAPISTSPSTATPSKPRSSLPRSPVDAILAPRPLSHPPARRRAIARRAPRRCAASLRARVSAQVVVVGRVSLPCRRRRRATSAAPAPPHLPTSQPARYITIHFSLAPFTSTSRLLSLKHPPASTSCHGPRAHVIRHSCLSATTSAAC
ncbi:hypothetical protein IWZ00DRAFT_329365 [Phyllosticta capitalensis]